MEMGVESTRAVCLFGTAEYVENQIGENKEKIIF